MEKRLRSRTRQRWVESVNDNLNKCIQGAAIANGMDRVRWKNIVEVAKALQGL